MKERHKVALVCSFQSCDSSLKVDGILGPKTEAALDRYIKDGEPIDKLNQAWLVAAADLGMGGYPGKNNAGAYIKELRKLCGFPTELTGPWCAIFASACLLKAGIPIKSRGAYTLCEKMVNHPQGFEIESYNMEPGKTYIACWKRGRWDTHQEAHVRLVRRQPDCNYEGIGGNERGDKVVHSKNMLSADFARGLIMVVGWNS